MSPDKQSPKPLPQHVAIIMDGNQRWATDKGVTRISGHRAGVETVRKITRHASTLGIPYLTLYTFSSENWKRSLSWVEEFLGLLRWYLVHEIEDLKKNGVRVRVIGNRSLFPKDIQDLIAHVEEETKTLTTITVCLALSYGTRDEILRAIKKILQEDRQSAFDLLNFNENDVKKYLDTADIPDPDLLIRTSGEQRLSNFLLWQMAYTELYFSSQFWPDFTEDDFTKAIHHYQSRERRYGHDTAL